MNNELIYIVLILLIGIVIYLFLTKPTSSKKSAIIASSAAVNQQQQALPLRLQAYERLTLLSDRIAIPNLVQRLANNTMSAKLLQQEMVQNIRQEFEHNITQQIYVSRKAWNAVNHLKEQNIMLLHKTGSALDESTNGLEYCQALLAYLSENPEASLYENVSEVLASEAQLLM